MILRIKYITLVFMSHKTFMFLKVKSDNLRLVFTVFASIYNIYYSFAYTSVYLSLWYACLFKICVQFSGVRRESIRHPTCVEALINMLMKIIFHDWLYKKSTQNYTTNWVWLINYQTNHKHPTFTGWFKMFKKRLVKLLKRRWCTSKQSIFCRVLVFFYLSILRIEHIRTFNKIRYLKAVYNRLTMLCVKFIEIMKNGRSVQHFCK